MIDNHSVFALVPARGGSKGLPGKNLHPLGGKPLLTWTIEVAKAVSFIDRTVVSTDDPAIAEQARRSGAELASRPDELATDEALMMDVIRHHLRQWEAAGEKPGILVLLQPTSPLRTPEDIAGCLRPLAAGTHESAATFCEASTHPYRAWRLLEGAVGPFIPGAVPWLPRQALPPAHELSGSVYSFLTRRLPASAKGPLFGRIAPVLIPPERAIDIDTRMDLLVAEALLATGDTVQGRS